MTTAAANRLTSRLDKDMAWRKRELVTVYLDIPDDPKVAAIKCRAALLLLYAHWEGFLKFAFSAYIEEVSRCVTDPRLFSNSLLGLSVKSWVLNVAERRDSTELGRVLREAMDPTAQLPRFRTAKLVQTKSNLSYEVLDEIFLTVGLEAGRFRGYRATIINPLVSNRNNIAHGEDLIVTAARFKKFYHSVLDLLEQIRDYLEDSLSNGVYLNRP